MGNLKRMKGWKVVLGACALSFVCVLQTVEAASSIHRYDLGRQDARPILNAIKKYASIEIFEENGYDRRVSEYFQPGGALYIRCQDLLVDDSETPNVNCMVAIDSAKRVRGVNFIPGRFGESYLLTLTELALSKPFLEAFARYPYESTTRVFFKDPSRGGRLVSFPVLSIECVAGTQNCWLAMVKQ